MKKKISSKTQRLADIHLLMGIKDMLGGIYDLLDGALRRLNRIENLLKLKKAANDKRKRT